MNTPVRRPRGRPRKIREEEKPKRPVGRPKKTDKERMTERALKTYKDIEGELDPAMALMPPDFNSTTRLIALKDRIAVNRFLKAVRLGVPDGKACSIAGFASTSFMDWRNRAIQEIERRDQGVTPDHRCDDYIIIYTAYCAARYAPLQDALMVINESITVDRNVETARWLAERQAPEGYSPTRRVEVSGREGAGVTVSHVFDLPAHRMDMLVEGSDDDVPLFDVVEGVVSEEETEDGRSTESGE